MPFSVFVSEYSASIELLQSEWPAIRNECSAIAQQMLSECLAIA